MPALAWHYTIGAKLDAIARDGALRPIRRATTAGERPILWFSRNPIWERSAAKMRWDYAEERVVWMTFQEHHAVLLVRFGLPETALTPWPALGRRAGLPEPEARRLEIRARGMAADPADWCGTTRPVALARLVCQVHRAGRFETIRFGSARRAATEALAGLEIVRARCGDASGRAE